MGTRAKTTKDPRGLTSAEATRTPELDKQLLRGPGGGVQALCGTPKSRAILSHSLGFQAGSGPSLLLHSF